VSMRSKASRPIVRRLKVVTLWGNVIYELPLRFHRPFYSLLTSLKRVLAYETGGRRSQSRAVAAANWKGAM
jgi:hypothetical protein